MTEPRPSQPDVVYASVENLTGPDQSNVNDNSNDTATISSCGHAPAPVLPSSLRYFWGRITRGEAEMYLQDRGRTEGLFLLRESMSPNEDMSGNYAISVIHNNEVVHYLIQKLANRRYRIPEGAIAFDGPVELLYYYWYTADGLVTPLTTPCERNENEMPVAFRGVAYDQLEEVLQLEAKKLNIQLDKTLSPTRDALLKRLTPILHVYMPWFHGNITRQVAESRMEKAGLEDGLFLLRSRKEKNTYAITLCCGGIPRHYLITQRKNSLYAVEDGTKFDCLILLVENYHNKSDGLACKLKVACNRPAVFDHEKPAGDTGDEKTSVVHCVPPALPDDATNESDYMDTKGEQGPPDYNDCVFEKTYSATSIDMQDEESECSYCPLWLHKREKLNPSNLAHTVAIELKLRTYFPLYLFVFLLLVVILVLVAVFA